MTSHNNKTTFKTGEDSFGLYVDVNDYDSFDELEDILIEDYGLIPIGSKAIEEAEGVSHRIWLDKKVGLKNLEKILASHYKNA